jgi:hypothetical protein
MDSPEVLRYRHPDLDWTNLIKPEKKILMGKTCSRCCVGHVQSGTRERGMIAAACHSSASLGSHVHVVRSVFRWFKAPLQLSKPLNLNNWKPKP